MSPLKTFVIYDHKDLAYREGLEQHLARLVRMSIIELWSDHKIIAGEIRNDVIQQKLDEADVILMLISVHFYNSNCVGNSELSKAKERFKRQEVVLVPIHVRPCEHEDIVKDLTMLPKNLTPIQSWKDPDEAYSHVAYEIETLIEKLLRQRREKEKARLNAEKARLNAEIVAAEKMVKEATLKAFLESKRALEEEELKNDVIKENRLVTEKFILAKNVGTLLAAVLALGLITLIWWSFSQKTEQITNGNKEYAGVLAQYNQASNRITEDSTEMVRVKEKARNGANALKTIKLNILNYAAKINGNGAFNSKQDLSNLKIEAFGNVNLQDRNAVDSLKKDVEAVK